MIVLGPTEHPRSAILNNFEEDEEEEMSSFISSFSAISSLINALAVSTPCLCKMKSYIVVSIAFSKKRKRRKKREVRT